MDDVQNSAGSAIPQQPANQSVASKGSGRLTEILAYGVIVLAIAIGLYVWFVFTPPEKGTVFNIVQNDAVIVPSDVPIDENVPKPVDENKNVLKKCSELKGFACSDKSECKAKLLDSNDSTACCSKDCVKLEILKNCSDGTALKSCSTNLPFYCNETVQLIEKCSECGCSSGKICDSSSGKCNLKPEPQISLQKFAVDINKVEQTGNIVVPAKLEYTLRIAASSDNNISYISVVDSNPYNNFESDIFECYKQPYCETRFKIIESLEGKTDFNASIFDSVGKKLDVNKTVTVSGVCGNHKCDSSESKSICPTDC